MDRVAFSLFLGVNRAMTMSEQLGIFEAAIGCRQAFKEATGQPRLMVSQWAENRMADFNLWCAGAGAFTHEKTSLEYRLRTSPNILVTIINLLLMLKILVEDCIQGMGADNPTDKYTIANLAWQPSPTNPYQKS
jgi:hypothetical protein